MSSPKNLELEDDIDNIFPSVFQDVSKEYPTPETEAFEIDTSEDDAPSGVQGALAGATSSPPSYIFSEDAALAEDYVPGPDKAFEQESSFAEPDRAPDSFEPEIPAADSDQAPEPETPVAEAPGESTINRPNGLPSLNRTSEKPNPAVVRRELRPRRVAPQMNGRRSQGRRHIKAPSADSEPGRGQGRSRRRKQVFKPSGGEKGMPRREFEVERITDTYIEEGTLMQYFLVKWKGYGSESNTWEPRRNLAKCRLAIEAFERERGQKHGKKRVRFSSE